MSILPTSDTLPTSPRRILSERQRATVDALLEAGLEQLREDGYEQLAIRAVAARAGVTHTTAYTYFASKAHLVTEIYWRQLQAMPRPQQSENASLATRIRMALEGPALVLSGEPELAQAALAALLTTDPEVTRLRNLIGADLAARVTDALGPHSSAELTDALLLAFSGAMLQAGMGYFDFSGVVERMAGIASLIQAP